MGSILEPSPNGAPATQTLQIEVAGTAPIERIDLIRSGQIAQIDAEGQEDLQISRKIPRLGPGEYHYVRVIQSNGRTAWSSPIFAQ